MKCAEIALVNQTPSSLKNACTTPFLSPINVCRFLTKADRRVALLFCAHLIHLIRGQAVDTSKFVPVRDTAETRCGRRGDHTSFAARGSTGAGGGRSSRVTIVVMSRLVYRKGVDLLVPLIPQVPKRTQRMNK